MHRRTHNPVELLESRRLLSSSALDSIVAEPLLSLSPQATTSAVAGLSPAQVKKAYGIDQVSFNGGAIKGDGSGQTIAIVGAYNAPSILNDLKTFDKKIGLADPPSFKKVSQTGSTSSLPATDADWALELSLDVEWAHAVAPKANILLVEARSDTLNNLLSAVDYARSAAGVSVVSMSWGADEFWGETSYDSHFTTPAGHQGVTFVAASGDDGSRFGPTWPSVASNVLSVGGTALSLNSSSGTYGGERGWSGSGGGVSWYENEPGYQFNVQSTGARTSPDVSYNADPNSGFAVYDSTTLDGHGGWWIVGGTSAGAPQWAGLIAVADQGRALGGKSSLNGATQTLPTLYSLGNGASTYSADFHDIASGRTSWFVSAGGGYDLVSGLGSPKANGVIQALKNAPGGKVTVSKVAVAAAKATASKAVRTAAATTSDPRDASTLQALPVDHAADSFARLSPDHSLVMSATQIDAIGSPRGVAQPSGLFGDRAIAGRADARGPAPLAGASSVRADRGVSVLSFPALHQPDESLQMLYPVRHRSAEPASSISAAHEESSPVEIAQADLNFLPGDESRTSRNVLAALAAAAAVFVGHLQRRRRDSRTLAAEPLARPPSRD